MGVTRASKRALPADRGVAPTVWTSGRPVTGRRTVLVPAARGAFVALGHHAVVKIGAGLGGGEVDVHAVPVVVRLLHRAGAEELHLAEPQASSRNPAVSRTRTNRAGACKPAVSA